MKTLHSMIWLETAAGHIRFGPDRKAVTAELYEHMISRNRDFLEAGMSEDEADLAACRAMGDADEVGRALAEVHRPFWGRLLRSTRVLAALLALALLLRLFSGGFEELRWKLMSWEKSYWGVEYRAAAETAPIWPQQAEGRLGDYRVELLEAAWLSLPEAWLGVQDPLRQPCLALVLHCSSPDPFLGPANYGGARLLDEEGREYPLHLMAGSQHIGGSWWLLVAEGYDPAGQDWAVAEVKLGHYSGRWLQLPVMLEGGGA